MARFRLIALGVLITLVLCAGCGSGNRSGGPPGAPASPTGGPASSSAPSGPAASAATGSPPPPVGKHAAATVAGVTVECPDDLLGRTATPSPSPRPLRAEIRVKAVVRCETVLRTYPGVGEWNVELAEVADKGLEPFLTELRKPSKPASPDQVCPAIGYLVPWLALIDDHGTVLRPAVPTEACGQPSVTAMAALNRLAFRAVDAVRTQQTRSPEAVSSGCDQRWKDVVALEALRTDRPQGGNGETPGSPPASVLACLYRAGPLEAGLRTGDLVKGERVTGAAAAELTSESAHVTPLPAGCSDADSFVVINSEQGPTAYVELDGCHRVLTGDGRLGVASAKLISALQALGLS